MCEAEGIDLHEDVGRLIISEAQGSPRQMLVNLAQCRDAKDKKTALALLRSAIQTDATYELCKFILKGGSWPQVIAIVDKLEDDASAAESARYQVCNYVGGALKRATNNEQAVRLLRILEAFAKPYNQGEKLAPLLLSIGTVLFGE